MENNRVRIIAPANVYRGDNPQAELSKTVEFLESKGFIVSVQDEIFADPLIPFYANTQEKRLAGLRDAILSPDIDVIWAFRGGYGCGEIAEDCMDITPVGTKILIGCSDITVLHSLFNKHYNIPSIHGAVLTTAFAKNPATIDYIISLLNGKPQKIPAISLNNAAKSGDISGVLTGGNLTMLTTLMGTKLQPDTKGKIILLEDVAEPGYKIARMLNHLDKAGVFNEAAACIFGDFTNCTENFEVALQNFIDRHPNLPIFKVEGVGHGDVNHPLVFGLEASIIGGALECGVL
jgi:muramoyltetrapeptide carboxypeptidase